MVVVGVDPGLLPVRHETVERLRRLAIFVDSIVIRMREIFVALARKDAQLVRALRLVVVDLVAHVVVHAPAVVDAVADAAASDRHHRGVGEQHQEDEGHGLRLEHIGHGSAKRVWHGACAIRSFCLSQDGYGFANDCGGVDHDAKVDDNAREREREREVGDRDARWCADIRYCDGADWLARASERSAM